MNTLVKKIKPIVMGLFIAALAIGFSAFTNKLNIEDAWYYTSGEVTEASSYSRNAVELCDDYLEVICEIHAPEKDGKPNMEFEVATDITVKDQIELALQTQNLNTTVKAFRSE